MCATPVFRAIKEKYPNAYLAVMVSGRLKGLLKNNQHVDEVITYKHRFLFQTINIIRSKKFDWGFSLSGTSTSSLISFLGVIPNRAKITRRPRPLSELMTDWLTDHQILYKHHTYLPRRYLDLLELIEIKNPPEIKEVGFSAGGDEKAKEFDSFVGISITAGNKIKEWGDEKFKELAIKIRDKYGAKIVFIGSKNDEKRIRKILFPGAASATIFSLEELPSLLNRLKLLIAVDTGPIYIAHALKVPLIDIIGPVDPNEQPPHDAISLQVLPPSNIMPSSFVMKKPGRYEEHKKAIEGISVDKVFEAVEKLI